MAEHTDTYTNIIQRWCALTGIEYADLLTNESELFTQFGQSRLRKIWFETDWPDTIEVSAESVTDQEFTAGTDIAYILGVYETDPFSTKSTGFGSYDFRRKQDTVYVYGSDVPDTVYVMYKERTPGFSAGAHTVPYRFSEYIAHGAYADWLRTEQMTQEANIADSRASQLLKDELEILELDERNSKWNNGIKVYSPTSI